MMATTDDQAHTYANTGPRPAQATSIRERKCSRCRRAIPVGEIHVYDGNAIRWHVECYLAEVRS